VGGPGGGAMGDPGGGDMSRPDMGGPNGCG